MKTIFLTTIAFLLLESLASCVYNSTSTEERQTKNEKIKIESLNDSTDEYCEWSDSINATCYLKCKSDTLERYVIYKGDNCFNYTYFDNKQRTIKIKQFIELENELRLNEIVCFNDSGKIDENRSYYLEGNEVKEGTQIIVHPTNSFNKLVVIPLSNGKYAPVPYYTKSKYFEGLNPNVIIPKGDPSIKYLLKAILTDKRGEDIGGKDYYFDINNLLKRDIRKQLVAQ